MEYINWYYIQIFYSHFGKVLCVPSLIQILNMITTHVSQFPKQMIKVKKNTTHNEVPRGLEIYLWLIAAGSLTFCIYLNSQVTRGITVYYLVVSLFTTSKFHRTVSQEIHKPFRVKIVLLHPLY